MRIYVVIKYQQLWALPQKQLISECRAIKQLRVGRYEISYKKKKKTLRDTELSHDIKNWADQKHFYSKCSATMLTFWFNKYP